MKDLLNYWTIRSPHGWELLGFADLVFESTIGLKVDNKNVIPLYVFHNDSGWGDSEPTSSKFPWVLIARGNDDESRYMLFGDKNSAVKYAEKYINGDKVLDYWNDTYNDRKWQYQN